MTNQAKSPTILFHGTAAYNLGSFQSEIKLYPRTYGKYAFCASVSFEAAALFALRHTPAIDLSKTGIVMEFDAVLVDGGWAVFKSHGVLQEEHEIRVFDAGQLLLTAYHEYNNGTWRRVDLTGGDR